MMSVQVFSHPSAALASKVIPSIYIATPHNIFLPGTKQSLLTSYTTFPVPVVFAAMRRWLIAISQRYLPHLFGILYVIAGLSAKPTRFTCQAAKLAMAYFICRKTPGALQTFNDFPAIRIGAWIIHPTVVPRNITTSPPLLIQRSQFQHTAASTLNSLHNFILTQIGTLRKTGWKPSRAKKGK